MVFDRDTEIGNREVIGLAWPIMVSMLSYTAMNLAGGNPIGSALVSGCPLSTCGDCNEHGALSILDALHAAQAAVGIAALTPRQFSNCNVTATSNPTRTRSSTSSTP